MAYRLIASDIDGTLLTDEGELLPQTSTAITMAKQQGAIFTLATGRPIQGVLKYLPLVTDDTPVITCNGAVIVTAKTGRVLHEFLLPYHTAQAIIEDGLSRSATVVVWAQGRLYVSEPCGYAQLYATLSSNPALELSLLPETEVTKIIWILSDAACLSLQAGYTPPEGAQYKASGNSYLEFFSSQAGKGAALKWLAEDLSIPREQVMALGDNCNDEDMLAWAGLGIAMGNAPRQVKLSADYITGTNQQSGAADAIEKFVLQP